MLKEMEILKLGDKSYEIVDRKSRDDLAGVVKKPLVAEVGQALIVKAVDENGVPTEFEAGTVAGEEEYDAVIRVTITDGIPTATLVSGDFELLKTKIMDDQTLKLKITMSGFIGSYVIVNPFGVIYDDINNIITLITAFVTFVIAPDNTITISQ